MNKEVEFKNRAYINQLIHSSNSLQRVNIELIFYFRFINNIYFSYIKTVIPWNKALPYL